MEKTASKKIFIDQNENTDSVIGKMEQEKETEIALVIPRNSALLQDLTNLKKLSSRAKDLKKNIFIIKSEDRNSAVQVNKISDRKLLQREKKEFLKNIYEDNKNYSLPNSDADNEAREAIKTDNQAPKQKEAIKKIFDIIKREPKIGKEKIDVESFLPPTEMGKEFENSFKRKLKQEEIERKNLLQEEKEIASDQKKTRRIALLPSISSKFFIGFISICVIIAVAAAILTLPEANISIVLKPENAVSNFEFTADRTLKEIDAQQNKIPLEEIEIENQETESYPTTGKKHLTNKANGEIAIFNEYSSNPQMLVANTRFLSKEGYLFRTKEPVIIPGFSRIEGNDVPGKITVIIYADKPGEEYNIEPTSFNLPGLQGSAKYSSIYARSEKRMAGGIDKEVLYFSESDYLTAKDKLVKKVKDKNEQDLNSKISEQENKRLENTEQKDNAKITSSIKIGDAADTFQMAVSLKSRAVFIRISDIDKLVNEKISSKLDQNKELISESKKYEIKDINTNEKGETIIPLYLSYSFINKVSAEKIKQEIAGKNETELKEYFSSKEGLKSTDVNLWPFWVKNIPSSPDKINITIDINRSI